MDLFLWTIYLFQLEISSGLCLVVKHSNSWEIIQSLVLVMSHDVLNCANVNTVFNTSNYLFHLIIAPFFVRYIIKLLI